MQNNFSALIEIFMLKFHTKFMLKNGQHKFCVNFYTQFFTL